MIMQIMRSMNNVLIDESLIRCSNKLQWNRWINQCNIVGQEPCNIYDIPKITTPCFRKPLLWQ